MQRPHINITLTTEERRKFEETMHSRKAAYREVQRARLMLLAAEGMANTTIAREIRLSRAMVVQWRQRFAKSRLDGLQERPGRGRKPRYDNATEERILAQLDNPPPAGYSSWSGRLLSRDLGDVSCHQVWRVLKRHGIHLQRRHSWCISTDPEFARKAADIIALYLHPPENALVLSIDEKPAIQALERAQGWLRLPNGKSLRGFNHEYKRHGTTTLFAALEVTTGLVHTGHYRRRRRREFLDFMNRIVAQYPGQELHVILDNLNIHKPKHDRWLSRHPNVHFHYTPTHASWLNQIECWFSILWRQALRGMNATSIRDICRAIDAFTQARNQEAEPFEWTKQEVHPGQLNYAYSQLRK